MVLRIGEFARLARVSLKTLHHYDEIGLLRPAQVDPFTGYRSYALEQLADLNRILALRDLGFTLDQVRTVLREPLSVEQLRGILRLRRAELAQELADAQRRLTEVDLRLTWIEKEETMPHLDISVKTVPAITVAGARAVCVDATAMREHCIALDAAACALIRTARLATDGVSFALYYEAGQESADAGIDVEMAYAVQPPAAPVPMLGEASVHELPAAQVATALYQGSYDDFAAVGALHVALRRWIETQGYRIAGPAREFYRQPPHSGRSRLGVMEIQYPIA